MSRNLIHGFFSFRARSLGWFRERLPIETVSNHLKEKTVPKHRHTIWYYLGGITVFLFGVQIISGALLMIYYKPTIDGAHQSVAYITNEVPFGWLVRSIHSWAAHLMIASLLLHLISVFYLQAYRRPRELMWISGCILLFLVLGFGFTGYLLPWDDMAYYATQIGTEVPKSIRGIGPLFVGLLRGGEAIGEATIPRMYMIHVFILPIATLLLIGLHLALNQYYGSSKPIGTATGGRGIPFYPNFILRDIRAWGIVLILLLCLATLMPRGLGPEANLLRPAPEGIKPEWYFVPVFQTLKILPPKILLFDGEIVLHTTIIIGSFMLVLLPFIDRKSIHGEHNSFIRLAGTIILIYGVGITIGAYISNGIAEEIPVGGETKIEFASFTYRVNLLLYYIIPVAILLGFVILKIRQLDRETDKI
jgi:cytochrome b6